MDARMQPMMTYSNSENIESGQRFYFFPSTHKFVLITWWQPDTDKYWHLDQIYKIIIMKNHHSPGSLNLIGISHLPYKFVVGLDLTINTMIVVGIAAPCS